MIGGFTKGVVGQNPEADILDISVLLDVNLSGLVGAAAKADVLFDEFIFFEEGARGALRIAIDADGDGPNTQRVSITLEHHLYNAIDHDQTYLATLIDQGNLFIG